MKISFAEPGQTKKGALVVMVAEDRQPTPAAQEVDRRTEGAVTRAFGASRFSGKAGELLELTAPAGLTVSRVVLLGIGKPADLAEGKAAGLGGGLAGYLLAQRDEQATVAVELPDGAGLSATAFAVQLAFGARLRGYRFDKYRTRQKPEDRPVLAKLAFMVAGASAAKKEAQGWDKLADGVQLARDLVTEPPNVIFPAAYADRLKGLSELGLQVEVLDEKDMRKLGMAALLGVGQGSTNPPRLVVMRWNGVKGDKAPVAFVGKGITFDSGGLSLKPPKGMEEMKWDMAGSAAVVGVMAALAGRGAKVNAVGVVALAENMPSGTAQRPGDVVGSMSGQTIEVLNTDAEGRLVLADALWYAQDRFKPVMMVNLATLTGAIITALGHEHAGMFSNDDALSQAIDAAGRAIGETVWRMPLGDAYDKQINSDIADMKNIGDGTGGSIIGAQFLQRFVNGVPWAHLDIAGVAWTKKDGAVTPKGASGWGVRLLDRLIRDKHEAG